MSRTNKSGKQGGMDGLTTLTRQIEQVNAEAIEGVDGWKHTTLGDIASAPNCLIQTGPFGSQLHKHEYRDQGVGVVNPTHLSDNRIAHEDVPHVSNETAKRLERHRLAPGDILFARRGEIGRHGLVSEAENGWLCGTGCFLVRIRREDVNNHFLSFFLTTGETVDWLNRHAAGVVMPNLSNSVLHRVPIALPPLAEQQKIAAMLGLVQRALEQQERLIAVTTELKKALLHQLFTRGLRGEPQKQTEIGPVPASWDLVSCEDICEMITVGVVVKPASHYVPKGVPAFRSFNVREDQLAPNNLVYFSETDNSTVLAKSKLCTGDVLVVRTGYPGTSCVVPEEYDGANCIDLVIVRPKIEVIRSGFLSRFFNAPAGKLQAVAAKHGLAQQHLNVGAVKRTRIPIPSLEEQEEIDFALATIQWKIFHITARKKAFEDLFRTLLHQLMTAQIRVHTFRSLF